MDIHVVDNPEAGRFEAEVDGAMARAEYHIAGNAMVLKHTEVPTQFRGQGVAEALARFALDAARTRGLKVVPLCPYMARFIERHPEFHDLLAAQ